ncbi:MAG: ABC transporter permease [Rhodothermales bacterium]|nr:ABC transporter permease [Rhodothermales bacterium]MBO6781141.1 ABC transporter permease [Rhodothermales bacterium]
MFLTHFRMALRHLRKHAYYTGLNLLGLGLGLASVLLIGMYVRHELSYDRFHEAADRIYRVAKFEPVSSYLGNNGFAVTPAPLEPELEAQFPGVEAATQVQRWTSAMSSGSVRSDESGLAATPGFFEVFSFELEETEASEPLSAPGNVVLTRSLAEKLFGAEPAVGKVLSAAGEADLTVVGVMEDVPATSHLKFDFVVSMSSDRWHTRNLERGEWDSSNYVTYVRLHAGASVPEFERQLGGLAREKLAGLSYYQENPDRISSYFAQPLTRIHLHSRLNFELGRNGNASVVMLFGTIGLLILLLAAFNYINLATAKALTRIREAGVRKALGASRGQLVRQFLAESVVLSMAALVLAAVAVEMALPWFGEVSGRALGWGQAGPASVLVLLGLGLAVGVAAGGYPALVLASADPKRMMVGSGTTGARSRLRNALVVAQFAVAVGLIAGALVVERQLGFIQNAALGVDREHLVVVPMRNDDIRERYETVREELMRSPAIVDVTASRSNPTNIISQSGATGWEGAEEGQRIEVYNSPVAPNFTEVLGIRVVEGQALNAPGVPRAGMLINEEMKRQLGWDVAVGRNFEFQGMELTVAGVMEDFNFLPYRQQLAPLAVYQSTRWVSQFLIRIQGQQTEEALAHIGEVVSASAPEYPFTYRFLDDAYDAMYQSERRLGDLFAVFTLLALVIACLGLVGLASFAAARRNKEMSVRKVLGASALGIVALLSRDFLALIAISLGIGLPVAWYFASDWLEGFAYRAPLGVGVFALAAVAVLVLGLASVAWQSVRVARSNAAEMLRTE